MMTSLWRPGQGKECDNKGGPTLTVFKKQAQIDQISN